MKSNGEPAALVLGRFVSELSWDRLDPAVRERARQCLVDGLGCVVGGSGTASGKSCAEVAGALGGPDESRVYGQPFCVAAPNAALANGTMAHSLELDDSLYGHTASAVIPATLAVAEKSRCDGERLLTAIVAGYEVFNRVGRIVNRMFAHDRGFHPTGLAAPFGAAAVAGSLLRQSPEQVASALGIAGSQAAGLMEYLSDGSWTKRLHPGWGAHAGITAALLAGAGFTGPWTVLEGRSGFFRAYLDEEVKGERIWGDLGEEFLILSNSFKVFSCCRQIHSTLTGVLEIAKRRTLSPREIAEVRCVVLQDGYQMTAEPREPVYRPRSVVDAQFSLPFSVAALIGRGSALLDSYTEDTIRDPETLSLAARVKAAPNPEFDRLKVEGGVYPAEVTISFTDGTEEFVHVEAPRGHPRNPVPAEQLESKFRMLASLALSASTVTRVSDMLDGIERMPDAARRIANEVSAGYL